MCCSECQQFPHSTIVVIEIIAAYFVRYIDCKCESWCERACVCVCVRWLQLIARYAGCLFDAHPDKCSSKSGKHHTFNTHCDPLTYYLRSSSSTWFMWLPTFERKMVVHTLAHTHTHKFMHIIHENRQAGETDERWKKFAKWRYRPWNSRSSKRTHSNRTK